MENRPLRQPIICVLGHVDHGKTTFLDAIRGTTVAASEAGGITQRIGATDIPIARLERAAKAFPAMSKLRVPGLLFVDTPGHVAFSNMRARGGALADIAILVIDMNEGIMPQTLESVNTLKKFRTPFIIVANKIDLVPYAIEAKNTTFGEFIKIQRQEYLDEFDKRFYKLVGQLYDAGFPADRYDRITDFSKTVAIVPASAKSKVGILDATFVITGLAQRFLESEITLKEDAQARGTIIEVKKEESIGTMLDLVLYQGRFNRTCRIALNTRTGPAVTRIKAIFVNRSSRGKDLEEKEKIAAAAAVRLLITDKLDVIPGSPIIGVKGDSEIEVAFAEIIAESQPHIETTVEGITLKADALGSLEAFAYEVQQRGIKIRSASIGDISKKDLINVSTINNPMDRVIAGFNVSLMPDAREDLVNYDASVITGNIIYSIVQDLETAITGRKSAMEESTMKSMPIPSRISIMPEYIFRATKPVIVGVKVYTGRIKVGDTLIKKDGKFGGTVKSIREGQISKQAADAPCEVAVAIDGVTLNRQIHPDEALYVDIPESVVRELRKNNLDSSIMETLEEIIRIKRKDNIFWGTRA
ncbi:eukaryotic translation initiation factor 5B [mine drainage metagenome]|uniref:Probable translation initiation factor IF-2 n=1 Tax=mine drainage metagenome TaxID=410659 RepID=T0Y2U5_9ZZZZ